MDRDKKPKKPRKNYPLTANGNGQWSKKIRGRVYYFGPWSDPDGAERRYIAELPSILNGRRIFHDAHGRQIDDDCELSLSEAINSFLEFKLRAVQNGELTDRSWKDYRDAGRRVSKFFGRTRPLPTLGPSEFLALRTELCKTLGVHALGRTVQLIKTMLNHPYEMELIDRPVRFGKEFKKPSAAAYRRRKAQGPPRFFDAHEIRALLAASREQRNGATLEAMIMLGINAALIPKDCSELTEDRLDESWLEFARPKTGIPRNCPLWPETSLAISEAMKGRRVMADKGSPDLVFRTRLGTPFTPHRISAQFSRLGKKAGVYKEGRGFASLRHTFETIGGDSRDQVAVDHIMGHVDKSMAAVYREFIKGNRLRDVSEHVRAWLFDPAAAEAA